jgi:hypothetical protein
LLSSSTTTTHQLGRALYSHQGYGNGKGDPAAEHPESQGVSPRTRELEHPGPEQAKKESTSNTNKEGGASGQEPRKASPGTSKSQKMPSRSAKEALENEMARGRGQ